MKQVQGTIRDGKIARAPNRTSGFVPAARVGTSGHYCASRALKVFLKINALVVLVDDAQRVSNWNHISIFTNSKVKERTIVNYSPDCDGYSSLECPPSSRNI